MPLLECAPTPAEGVEKSEALIRLGPGLVVLVGPPSAADPQVADNPQQYIALIDTGAQESCIDGSLATELKLPLIDKMMIGGSAGAHEHSVYLAVVSMPSIQKIQYGRFAGVDLAGGGQIHRVLLGRTFLSQALMIYDGFRCQVTLST